MACGLFARNMITTIFRYAVLLLELSPCLSSYLCYRLRLCGMDSLQKMFKAILSYIEEFINVDRNILPINEPATNLLVIYCR